MHNASKNCKKDKLKTSQTSEQDETTPPTVQRLANPRALGQKDKKQSKRSKEMEQRKKPSSSGNRHHHLGPRKQTKQAKLAPTKGENKNWRKNAQPGVRPPPQEVKNIATSESTKRRKKREKDLEGPRAEARSKEDYPKREVGAPNKDQTKESAQDKGTKTKENHSLQNQRRQELHTGEPPLRGQRRGTKADQRKKPLNRRNVPKGTLPTGKAEK